jgi:hypothetical protein
MVGGELVTFYAFVSNPDGLSKAWQPRRQLEEYSLAFRPTERHTMQGDYVPITEESP